MKKQWLALLLVMVMVLLTACSGGTMNGKIDYESGAVYDSSTSSAVEYAPGAGLEEQDLTFENADGTRKLIHSSTLRLETLEFDEAVQQIRDLVADLGGYMESSSVQGTAHSIAGRSASFVCRVPATSYRAANERLAGVGNVISRMESAEDVTDHYYDVQAELEALRVQQERLLTMMEQATDMQDLILLEEELTEVRYRINDRTSAIKRYDGLIEYATINIELDEVEVYQEAPPVTFGDRIAETFAGSLEFVKQFGQGVVLVLVAVLPFVVVYGGLAAVIAGLIVLIVKLSKRGKKKKKA